MKQATEYQYRKRIKELEKEALEDRYKSEVYRSICLEIMEAVALAVDGGNHVSKAWLIRQLRRAMR